MHTVNLLTTLVENHQILAYAVIFLGLILEGEIVVISAGVFSQLGALDLPLVLLFIFLGGISKTFIGYALGKFLHKKFNHLKFMKYVEKKVHLMLPRFEVKPFWSVFASKFIIGANNLVIVFSGYRNINYKKFLRAEMLATVIWTPLLLSLGYVFSYAALQMSREIWRFSMIVLALLISFIIFDKLAGFLYELFEEFKDAKRAR